MTEGDKGGEEGMMPGGATPAPGGNHGKLGERGVSPPLPLNAAKIGQKKRMWKYLQDVTLFIKSLMGGEGSIQALTAAPSCARIRLK